MLAVCVDTHPLLVAHCRHFRLIIEQSDINIGQVKLRFVTDFFKFSQSVFIQDSGLVKATYNHSLNMLATLHSNWTMAVSRLDLDLDKRVCKHQVLTLTQVPFGLTLSEIWFHGAQMFLYQDKSITYPERHVDRMQLALVDTKTGQVRTLYVPVKNMDMAVMIRDSMLVLDAGKNVIKSFVVSLDQLKDT